MVTTLSGKSDADIKDAFDDFAGTHSRPGVGEIKITSNAYGAGYTNAEKLVTGIAGVKDGELTGSLAIELQGMMGQTDVAQALKDSMASLGEHGFKTEAADRVIKQYLKDLQNNAGKIGKSAGNAIKKHNETATKLLKGFGELQKELLTFGKKEGERLLKEVTKAEKAAVASSAGIAEKTALETAKAAFDHFNVEYPKFSTALSAQVKEQIEGHTKAVEEITSFIGKLEENGIKIDTNIKREMLVSAESLKSGATSAESAVAHTEQAAGHSKAWGIGLGAAAGLVAESATRADGEESSMGRKGVFVSVGAGLGFVAQKVLFCTAKAMHEVPRAVQTGLAAVSHIPTPRL